MHEIVPALGWLLLAFYVVSFWCHLSYFKMKNERRFLQIRVWSTGAVCFHSIYLVLIGLELGHLPVGNIYQVLTTCAWFFVLVYLALELRLKEKTMGLFLLPIVLVLQGISNAFIDLEKPLAPVLATVLYEGHVAIMIAGYAAFSISFISSVLYILLAREMHSKRLGIFFDRLPSLEFFDELSNQAVNIGLVMVSAGIALGYYLGMNVWEGLWALDPKLLAVGVSWIIYALHFVTRKAIGWQGRRAAFVSVIGFNWLLFSFLIVSLFFSKFHNFQ